MDKLLAFSASQTSMLKTKAGAMQNQQDSYSQKEESGTGMAPNHGAQVRPKYEAKSVPGFLPMPAIHGDNTSRPKLIHISHVTTPGPVHVELVLQHVFLQDVRRLQYWQYWHGNE